MIMLKNHINLHIFQFYLSGSQDKSHQALAASLNEANQQNLKLNQGEKELLISQLQLVHISFGKIKYLSLNGQLLLKCAAAAERALKVVCLSCKFGKKSKRSDGADKTQPRYDKWIYIKKGYMFPCHIISVDHYVRSLPVPLYIYKGGPQENYMLNGGMIFTDHSSRYVSTGHKVNLSYG